MPKIQWNLKFVDVTSKELAELESEGLVYESENSGIFYPEDDVSLLVIEEKIHFMRKDGV
jgi:DNA-binding transcriptional regulator YhcF (GntR family)